MMANQVLTLNSGMVLDDEVKLSLVELCEACRISAEYVIEMVEEGVVEPEGSALTEWRFDAVALKRLQTALRLQRDLRVNLPGAALALDLLDELEALRRRESSGMDLLGKS